MPADIRLLTEVDEEFDTMSGLATCELLRRAFEIRGDGASSGWPISSARTTLRAPRTYRTR